MKQYGGRRAFTLIELLVSAAISSLVLVAFISTYVIVARIAARQGGATEVQTQSQFVLQQLQYEIANSSLIDMTTDSATSTLRLRMSSTSTDPTIITLSSGTLYMQQGTQAQIALTSSRVVVNSITFTKRANSSGHDSVAIALMVSYNTSNPQQLFAQTLQTAITRVSAATFDSNLVPSSTATYNLGLTGQIWNSVNNVIYFSGSNVGIGISSPHATFQVHGGDIYNDTTGNGLLMRSPDGTCWRWTPANTTGALTAASTTCP